MSTLSKTVISNIINIILLIRSFTLFQFLPVSSAIKWEKQFLPVFSSLEEIGFFRKKPNHENICKTLIFSKSFNLDFGFCWLNEIKVSQIIYCCNKFI